MKALRNYSSQADPDVLKAMQDIADQEGRQLQTVIGDAMREYLVRRQQQPTDPAVPHSRTRLFESRSR